MMQNVDWMRTLPGGKAISGLGFGCSSIWAQASFPDDVAERIFAAGVEEGINHYDTGPSYGNGVGETRLARCLKGRDATALVLSTKVGTNLIDGKVSRSFAIADVEKSFAQSMNRLRLDHIDVLYLHGPSVDDLNDDIFAFFDRLKKQGRIRWSGVNSFDAKVLDAVTRTPIDAVMLQYNAADQSLESQIEHLDGTGKIVISGTALGRMQHRLSTFVPRNRNALWYLLRMLRKDPAFLFRAQKLSRNLTVKDKSTTEVALQFVLGHPKILSNLFGTSSVAHMVENARAGHGSLAVEQWQRLAPVRRKTVVGHGRNLKLESLN